MQKNSNAVVHKDSSLQKQWIGMHMELNSGYDISKETLHHHGFW